MLTILNGLATALFTYGSHSLAACLVALGVGRLLHRPQDRDIVWKAAIVLPVLTATWRIASGTSHLRFDLSELVRRAGIAQLPGRQVVIRVLDDNAGHTVFRQVIDPVATSLSGALAGIALACIAVACARLVHRRAALSRALAGRVPVRELPGVGAKVSVRLSVAEALPSPVALGRSEICLPSVVVDTFSREQRDVLVAHEVAHLERRDPHWFFAVEVVSALSAFQPLAAVVARAFRQDVELICDEVAARAARERYALIGALARLASPFDPCSPLLGAATAYDGSSLVERATRIATAADEHDGRRSRRHGMVAALLLVAALGAVPVVTFAPRLDDLTLDPLGAARRAMRAGRIVTVDSTVTDRHARFEVVIR